MLRAPHHGPTKGAQVDGSADGCSGVEAALRQQLLALDRLDGRLANARTLLPSAGGGGVWEGDARRMYVHALERLSAQVRAAGVHVEDAVRNTRRAIASLGGGTNGG